MGRAYPVTRMHSQHEGEVYYHRSIYCIMWCTLNINSLGIIGSRCCFHWMLAMKTGNCVSGPWLDQKCWLACRKHWKYFINEAVSSARTMHWTQHRRGLTVKQKTVLEASLKPTRVWIREVQGPLGPATEVYLASVFHVEEELPGILILVYSWFKIGDEHTNKHHASQ